MSGKNHKRAETPKPTARLIPSYAQCPLCFHGNGGVGKVYCTQGNVRYYKCCSCWHTWTARTISNVSVVKVEHRTVTIETRDE